MAILKVLFRRSTPRQVRMMAALNVVACTFVTVMTLLTTCISFFMIVPFIFKDSERAILLHRCAIGYLFVNVCGNFIVCVCTDTSTAKRTPRKTPRQKRNVSSRSTSRRTDVLENDSRKMCSTSVSAASSSNQNLLDSGVKNMTENEHTPSTPSVSGKPESSESKVRNSSSKIQSCNRTPASPDTDTQHPVDAEETVNSPPKNPQDVSKEPARSHQCKLCEKRILRRDHHCFFMMVCIGYHNHKHFIFFCLYMMIGALYGVILTVRFLHLLYNVRFYGPQTFVLLLLQVLHNVWVKGVAPSPLFALLLYQLYVCLAVGLVAGGFLYWHLAITVNGQTTHEATRGDVRYRRRLTSNLRDVFGRYWPLLLLLPLPLPQAGDGRSYIPLTTTTTPTTTTTSKDDDHDQDSAASAGAAKKKKTKKKKTTADATGRKRGSSSSSQSARSGKDSSTDSLKQYSSSSSTSGHHGFAATSSTECVRRVNMGSACTTEGEGKEQEEEVEEEEEKEEEGGGGVSGSHLVFSSTAQEESAGRGGGGRTVGGRRRLGKGRARKTY